MAPEEKLSAKVSNAASDMASDIGSFIRSQRELAQVSVRQLAEKSGVSNPYLSQVERGLRKPSADVLNQIAKALRVSAEVLYVRAGILEPSDKSQVRDAIITDAAITERQKQVLLDIYTSFTQQNESGRIKQRGVFAPNPTATSDQVRCRPAYRTSTSRKWVVMYKPPAARVTQERGPGGRQPEGDAPLASITKYPRTPNNGKP